MKTILWLTIIFLLNCLPVLAQGVSYKPSQNVIVVVTFEGKDASKVTGAEYTFQLDGQVPSSQPRFNEQLTCGQSKSAGRPNTFEISCSIPTNAADGDYHLSQITALFREFGNMGLLYNSAEFPARKIRIDNSNTLTKPAIKDVQVH